MIKFNWPLELRIRGENSDSSDPTQKDKGDQTENAAATRTTAAVSQTADAVSASSVPTNTGVPAPHDSGVSTGAIAGAAVGCLIAGLLVGILVAFLLRRRAQKQQSQSEAGIINEKPNLKSTASGSSDVKLDHFLFDSTPDKDIARELGGLGDLIQLHVDTNYHAQPVQVSPSTLTQALLSLGFVPKSASAVASLCIDPRTRAFAIRHVISNVSFTSVDANAKSHLSLLPAPIAAFLQSIPPLDSNSGSQPENTTLAFSKWRTLSAYLLHPTRSERQPLFPTEATSLAQIQGLVSALNTALGHFIEPAQQEGQLKNLQAVLLDVAKFGYVLLSQPIDWGFVYDGKHGRELVLRAGLQKLSQRDGTRYSSPHIVVVPDFVELT